jgi:hypothetical protein
MANVRHKCVKCGGLGRLGHKRLFAYSAKCDACGGKGYVEASNVVYAPILTKLALDPDRILREAAGKLDCVVVIGYTKDGAEYYASSIADGANALWHMQRGIHNLMNIADEGIEE